ncbi:MAG: hypothetical protein SOX97_10565 [Sutterella sp.]|nr:hypothetical protein [Sutterella sp.]
MKPHFIIAAVSAAALLSACANLPEGSERLHLITEQEAADLQCQHLDYAGSASALLINGKARNSAVIVRKALSVEGSTHLSFTKGKPGYAFTKANIWKCPNPNYTTKDPGTQQLARDYFGHL